VIAFIGWLAGWYNWPFLFPLAVGVLFILVDVTLGGLSDLIGLDAGGDGPDADVDVHVHADVDAHADFDVHAHGPEVHGPHAGGPLIAGLGWIGLGKVPISVLLEVMFIVFGVVGLVVNAVASDALPIPAGFVFPIALVAASVAAPVVTRAVGGFIASVVPADATTSRKPSDFQGEVGVTASVVTARIGQVRIEASATHPATVLTARCDASVQGDLPRGQEVLVVGYDAAKNTYLIAPTPILES